jgi:hypothetical protein
VPKEDHLEKENPGQRAIVPNFREHCSLTDASKLRIFSSVGCAVRTVKILTGWDFGAHGAPYYETYFP